MERWGASVVADGSGALIDGIMCASLAADGSGAPVALEGSVGKGSVKEGLSEEDAAGALLDKGVQGICEGDAGSGHGADASFESGGESGWF